ncbi:MAG TPA: serine hydrolase domain-containing protein, partial [Pyrinomonadaceae bacterium]|nr:serine hydrolase domain-containing protein [Pyrinomonadaceae bacterium]
MKGEKSERFILWHKFLFFKTLILSLLQISIVQAQQTEKPVLADPKTLQTNIEKFVAPYLQMEDFSGAILISQNGKILFEKGFGLANSENHAPNTPTTRFRIGSLNKQLTAATILLLEEQGKLNTEDSVSKFFPNFPNGSQIKIQHLLTHKSGLPKYVPYQAGKNLPTSAELLKIIGSLQPEAKPGERYNYSNAGFVLLGLIVEKVAGKNYPQFLTENVFKPLGMKNSGVGFNQELAKGYVTGIGTEIVPAP